MHINTVINEIKIISELFKIIILFNFILLETYFNIEIIKIINNI